MMYSFLKIDTYVNSDEMTNHVHFWSVKVRRDKYKNNCVNMIEMSVHLFGSNLALVMISVSLTHL